MPGPEGRAWLDTTIRGQKERGTGILNNELYIGGLVWNRCSYVKDPRSSKRVARPNPAPAWERRPVPELRIIDDALWQAVKQRQDNTAFAMGRDEAGNALNRAHRRRFLLSGLLTCGCCGAGFTIVAKDRYGCAGRRGKGLCQNDRSISRTEIESRILTAIKQNLLTADLVGEFTRAYQEEVNRLSQEATRSAAENAARLNAVQRKIDGMLRAIEDGLYQPSMKARLAELEAEKASLVARQAAKAAPTVSVHPNLAELYQRKVAELEGLIDDPEHGDEAMELIRALIDRITLTPRQNAEGLDTVLSGDLAQILVLCVSGSGQTKKPSERCAHEGFLFGCGDAQPS